MKYIRNRGSLGLLPQLPVTGALSSFGVRTGRDRAVLGNLNQAERGGWLSGYSYRKSFTYSRPSGAVSNYPVKILVGESSGATGEDVDCNSHCLSTFNDLRFTDSDGNLLDYWIESISGTTPNQVATVWVELDSVGTDATTFYMYYGKADASDASSGADTFTFFDDFPGEALDSDKWTDDGGNTVSGGELVALADGAADHGVTSKTSYDNSYALRTRVKPLHANTTSYIEAVRFYDSGEDDHAGSCFTHVSSLYNYKHYNDNQGISTKSAIIGAAANTYCILDIMRNAATDVRYAINDANNVTIASNVPDADCKVNVRAYANGAQVTVDWILIRRYLVTPPALGSWGSEESA